ncbi:MAG: hypothetical protein HND50_17760 [Calditrichaeota bacterium]|nr:hypothetical protein [Calditrichota bacterium]
MEADDNGTDLTLINENVLSKERCEVIAGWVSVLLSLKAAVDYAVDLRNHNSDRTWDDNYAGN